MDMSKYLDLFVSEAKEHLQEAATEIGALAGGSESSGAVNSVFRHFHSIKGMANSMGFDEIASLSHAVEELFDRLRRRDESPSPEETDVVLEAIDAVSSMVASRAEGVAAVADTKTVISKIRAILPDTSQAVRPCGEAAHGATPRATSSDSAGGGTTRIPTQALDGFLDSISEIITRRETLREMIRAGETLSARSALDRLSLSIDSLRDQVMLIRLMPFEQITPRLAQSLRELCRKTGKRASLLVTGRDVSLDRSVLEALIDPLNHILRNAIDHGIEEPSDRVAAGKAPEGSIRIDVSREGDQVQVGVDDDGRGIDRETIKSRALSSGYASAEDLCSMEDGDLLMLTTLPGFSTAHTVTDISGRGVGMDVFRTRIEALGGRIRILSRHGQGTRIEMTLPLTVAVLDAFLVEGSAGTFAVPSAMVTGVRQAAGLEGAIGDETEGRIRVTTLDDLLGMDAPRRSRQKSSQPALIYRLDGNENALLVDRIIERRKVVVKPLGSPLERLRRYSGAALLDDGRVSLVLDLANLRRLARSGA